MRCRCGAALPAPKRTGRRPSFCGECQRVKHVKRNKARYESLRKGLITKVAQYIMAGDAPKRQRVDADLNRGTAKRRCQSCYRLYHLTALEAPCPDCGSHLIDHPVTFEVSHAA